VKAVGNLSDAAMAGGDVAPWKEPPGLVISDVETSSDVSKQTFSVTGQIIDPAEEESSMSLTWAGLEATRPDVNQDGEWILNAWDIECIAVGAGILGAGGGSNPNVGRVRARQAVNDWSIVVRYICINFEFCCMRMRNFVEISGRVSNCIG
jgi:hypothetical protein